MKGVNPIYATLLKNLPDFWRYHYNDHYNDFFIRERLFGKGANVEVPRDIDCFLDKTLMKAGMANQYLTHVGINASANEDLSPIDKGMLRMLSQSPDFYIGIKYSGTNNVFYPSFISYLIYAATDISTVNLVSYTDNAIAQLENTNTRQYDVAWWSNEMEGLKYFYPFVPTCEPSAFNYRQNKMLYRNDPSVVAEGDYGIITGDLISAKIPIIAHASPAFAISKAMSMGCTGVNTEIPDDWFYNDWPNNTFGDGVGGPDKYGYPVVLFVINDPLSLAHNGARFSSLHGGEIYISSQARYRVTSIGRLDWYTDPLKGLTQGVTVVEVTIEDESGGDAKDMFGQ
ncbi:hypothetical protein EDF81_4544 [Enterobacter sp. BIGb0383]|uniref:hypothetical protein n=1 Tax=unclassified Enterobacter TaxID=2608935 RepID=UPI000F4940DE|nr:MULTISPECIES: hypothetical protein [unclassified Enterobacter]ROP49007.1 hypothetical protein EDF81_4544 [Enterobacter sp. BIGb0383]ROS00619.1 hypothetical protein EC848_4555 [Enterobacter sp. BIGb0359]